MKIVADRDKSNFSLTRKGTYKIKSTSGVIPFKIRRLTKDKDCEALALHDDSVHINEYFGSLKKDEINKLNKRDRISNNLKNSLIDKFEEILGSTKGSDANILHIATPKNARIKGHLREKLIDILYYTKENHLILPPLNFNKPSLYNLQSIITDFKARGDVDPPREIVGYLPARCKRTVFELLTEEYIKAGVSVYAVDADNGYIPPGILGWLNARLDVAFESEFLVMVLGQPDIPKLARGQTVIANDVFSLPLGYDGCAPNRRGFSSDDPEKKNNKETPERWKKIRRKDEKGKIRLFVPYLWGRTQIAGILSDEKDIISRYNTKTAKKFDIVDMFNDDKILPDKFKKVLYRQDTELVEKELTVIGEATIEGRFEDIVNNRDLAKPNIPRISQERKKYEYAKERISTRQMQFI